MRNSFLVFWAIVDGQTSPFNQKPVKEMNDHSSSTVGSRIFQLKLAAGFLLRLWGGEDWMEHKMVGKRTRDTIGYGGYIRFEHINMVNGIQYVFFYHCILKTRSSTGD